MNVFVVDNDPIVAAKSLCDKHVVKMIVESAQMLSTAHRMLDGVLEITQSKTTNRKVKYYRLSDDLETKLYKACHHSHPCTIWTMESVANYRWHYQHFIALCDEYTYRYGKVHKTDQLLRNVLWRCPRNIPEGNLTKFKLAMKANPECMKDDPVESYRLFYQTKQDRFKMAWTKRDIPDWFVVRNMAA